MLGPDWGEGCPSCSYLADHFDGAALHLVHRDVTLTVVSRAPLPKIEAYKNRMGWRFPWASSYGSDFNFDFHVSFRPEEADGEVYYNYEMGEFQSDEMPGVSVFIKDASGAIFHTYSAYARGLDILAGAYNFLDLVPKGRDEAELPWSMAWVRRHDEYDDAQSPARAAARSTMTRRNHPAVKRRIVPMQIVTQKIAPCLWYDTASRGRGKVLRVDLQELEDHHHRPLSRRRPGDPRQGGRLGDDRRIRARWPELSWR